MRNVFAPGRTAQAPRGWLKLEAVSNMPLRLSVRRTSQAVERSSLKFLQSQMDSGLKYSQEYIVLAGVQLRILIGISIVLSRVQ